MKSFIRVLLFAAAVSFSESAYPYLLDLRHRKEEVKDTASMEVVYVHIATDPAKDKKEVKYEMLTIGNNFYKYGGYENYQLDSLYMADPDFHPPFEEYRIIAKGYDQVKESTLTDKEAGEITFYGKIFINNFRYTEPLPQIDWILSDESEEIMGYECKKATAKWRGREWTAWYSDIPVDAGPWKFQGLPGLIMKLEDATGQHYFEAMGTKNDVYPFGYGSKICSKTTREKFNAAYKDYCENFGKQFLESGMIPPPQSKEEEARLSSRTRFYAPIELE